MRNLFSHYRKLLGKLREGEGVSRYHGSTPTLGCGLQIADWNLIWPIFVQNWSLLFAPKSFSHQCSVKKQFCKLKNKQNKTKNPIIKKSSDSTNKQKIMPFHAWTFSILGWTKKTPTTEQQLTILCTSASVVPHNDFCRLGSRTFGVRHTPKKPMLARLVPAFRSALWTTPTSSVFAASTLQIQHTQIREMKVRASIKCLCDG